MQKIHDLVESLICEDEITEVRIHHLKEWINFHGGNVQYNKPSVEFCEGIEDILKDKTIVKEEKIELLERELRDFQFENKVANLCTRVKEKKNIGIDLIDLIDNESAIKEIHRMAERNLMQVLRSYTGKCMDQEIIVVSLVLIAMLEYDGNYYNNVKKMYQDLYAEFSQQKIENEIRSILNKYKKIESGSRSRKINVALENAIVPQTFLSAFFEFIFDIYKLNFEYDLPKDPFEDFYFVFDGLRNSKLSDGDDISINVTQKTYKLIASTKQLIIRDDDLEALIKLSIMIIQLIDKRFWNKEVKILNPYLKAGYEGWEKGLKENTKDSHVCRKSHSEFRSRWEPRFILFNQSVYLNPPIHRVKSQYDYRDIAIIVINDGQEIYRNNRCDIREIIGGYQVNTERIEINKPLGKLIYRLVIGDEIIYDSREKLYRSYIVFNDEGKELGDNTDFEGRVCIVYKEGEIELDNIIIKDDYCIGYKLVRWGEFLEIGHDIFSFSSMIKPDIFGKIYPKCGVKQEGKEKLMSVYYDTCFLVFEAINLSNKFEIVINDKSYKLKDMRYKATEKVGSIKYVVDLNIQQSSIYNIEVNQLSQGKRNNIFKSKLVYDTRLDYSKEDIDHSSYRVKIISSLFNNIIDKVVTIENFTLDFIEFEYNGYKYHYYIPFDFRIYKLSNMKWCSPNIDIWIGDISDGSMLTLYDSQCDGLSIYTESGILLEDDIKLIDKGYYKQFLVDFLISYKNDNRYVTLVFTGNKKAQYILRCYNKCIIDKEKTEILCYETPKKVTITPIFYGKNKVFYELFNPTGERIFKSEFLESGQVSTLTNFESFQEYKIYFHEMTTFLQIIKKPTPLLEVHRTFYAREDFVGRAFKIVEAHFNQRREGKLQEKRWFFHKYYVKFTNMIDAEKGIFEGQIYSKSVYRGIYYLYNINPVDIEISGNIFDDTMAIYITNQGDGLLFDYEHKGIMNSMEHSTAPDIFLYKISLKGEDVS